MPSQVCATYALQRGYSVLGDTPVLPRTIGEVLARRDHANWCEALEVELGAMHAMKVCRVA